MEAGEGLQLPLNGRNRLKDISKDFWLVPWPMEISLISRVLLLTCGQTFLFVLFCLFAAALPLSYIQVFTYLVAWTAFLALLVVLVASHVFQTVLEDAPGLGFRLFTVTTVCEGLAYLLLASSCPVVVLLFMAFSCAGQTTLSLVSLLFPAPELKKHGAKLIVCTLFPVYLIVISSYPLAYIFQVLLVPVNCLYLTLSLDDLVEMSYKREGRWKLAGYLALKVQIRKFAYPFRLLPQGWKQVLNDLLPIQARQDAQFDA